MARILIIEDCDDDRQGLEELLVYAKHHVSSAPNGKVGLELLRDRQIDVVITDMVMPEMDGVETILKLRREYPQVKIIAVSNDGVVSSDYYLRLARGLGAQLMLSKPYSASEMLEAIESLIEPK